LAGLALAAAIGGVAISASAVASASAPSVAVQDTRLFTGQGSAPKPPQAELRAANQAQQFAANAGYGHCEFFDSTGPEWNPDTRLYDATVTLACMS
jgi:hypothetical protein